MQVSPPITLTTTSRVVNKTVSMYFSFFSARDVSLVSVLQFTPIYTTLKYIGAHLRSNTELGTSTLRAIGLHNQLHIQVETTSNNSHVLFYSCKEHFILNLYFMSMNKSVIPHKVFRYLTTIATGHPLSAHQSCTL